MRTSSHAAIESHGLVGWDAEKGRGRLFAFAVVSAAWDLGTSLGPRVIELEAVVDNKEGPEGLPLAPWS